MAVPFEVQIATRYLLAKRKQAFISVISFISTLGVTVGVMALVIALALMTGLQQEVRERILGSNPHIFVWKIGGIEDYRAEAQKLAGLPQVTGAAPAIFGKALVTAGDKQAFITIKGIDPELERGVTDIESSLRSGSLAAIAPGGPEELPGILLGSDLAAQLEARAGDSISVVTIRRTLAPSGVIMVPRTMPFRVAGTFSLGLYEFDSSYGLVSLDVAKRLTERDEVELIQLRVSDMWAAPAIAEQIPEQLGPDYLPQDWQDMNSSLFSALWIEKIAISLTIGLIVIVAALNIVASLILLVMEKHRDIAILKTMGASARSVTLIFIVQGLIIGIVGTTVGAGLGYAVSRVADRYQLIKVPMDVYQIAYVPFTIEPADFLLVIVSAVLVCFLATIYPSRQAAKLDPAQALRYE